MGEAFCSNHGGEDLVLYNIEKETLGQGEVSYNFVFFVAFSPYSRKNENDVQAGHCLDQG